MAKTDGSMSDDAMETESRKSADDSDSDVDPDDEDAIERLRSSFINKLTPTLSEGSREPLLDKVIFQIKSSNQTSTTSSTSDTKFPQAILGNFHVITITNLSQTSL